MRNRNQQTQFHLGTAIRNLFIFVIVIISAIAGLFVYLGKTDVLVSMLSGDENKTIEAPKPIIPLEVNTTKDINVTVIPEVQVTDNRPFAEVIKDEQYKCDQMEAELKRWGTPITDDTKAQCIFVRSADIIISKENGVDHYRFNIPSGGN